MLVGLVGCGHVSVFRMSGGSAPREGRIEARGEFPLLAGLRAFAEHLRGWPPPRSSAAEGVTVVEAIANLRKLAGAP
jgi:hypothetical protein